MIKKLAFFLILPLLLGACLTHTPLDRHADDRLGVEAEDDNQDADATLRSLQESQLQEQRRALERQITDPLTS